jgi:hypothetical protein
MRRPDGRAAMRRPDGRVAIVTGPAAAPPEGPPGPAPGRRA